MAGSRHRRGGKATVWHGGYTRFGPFRRTVEAGEKKERHFNWLRELIFFLSDQGLAPLL